MMIGRSERARYRAFLVGVLAREGDFEMIESMKRESEGRKWFRTTSESAAERKVLETRECLQTSIGAVRDRMAEMHPSVNS
jgi:hypothetical protein